MNVYSSPVTGKRHKPILPARPLGDAVSTLLGQLQVVAMEYKLGVRATKVTSREVRQAEQIRTHLS